MQSVSYHFLSIYELFEKVKNHTYIHGKSLVARPELLFLTHFPRQPGGSRNATSLFQECAKCPDSHLIYWNLTQFADLTKLSNCVV